MASPPPSPTNPNSPSTPPSSASDAAAAAGDDSPTDSPPSHAHPSSAGAAPPQSSSSRRVPPPCWSLEETLALIDSYQEKWFSLRRGNLKASHWQEVADAVSRRCHRLPSAAPKTAVQCRHKVEKLRKRYRAERQRSLRANPGAPPSSSWVFFKKMDAMELGSAVTPPSGSRAPSAAPRSPPSLPSSSDSESASPSEDMDDHDGSHRSVRGLQGMMSNGGGGLRFQIPKAVRSKITSPRGAMYSNPSQGRFFRGVPPSAVPRQPDDMRRQQLEKKRKTESGGSAGGGGDGMAEVVSAVRMLGDGFMRMEQMKMDMASEIHKLRMEMELKRTEMVLDTQRRVVDAFVRELVRAKKRAKPSPNAD